MSMISLAIHLRGTTACRRVGTTIGTTTRNRVGNILNCARSSMMSASFGNRIYASIFSTGTNVTLGSGFIGLMS